MSAKFSLRPVNLDDAPALASIRAEYAREVGLRDENGDRSMRHVLQLPGLDLRGDSLAASVDGEIVGYNLFRHADDPRLWGGVGAPFRRRGIGTALMAWGVGRARAEQGLEKVFAGTSSLRSDAHALYRRSGFAHARTFNAMVHSDPGSVRAPTWPPGTSWRNDLGEQALAVATDVHNRGFVGHWDYRPMTEEAMGHALTEPGAGPEMSFFAYLLGLPVAFCLCRIDGSGGFINMLATDPVARGRGIGLALLKQAIVEMSARGATLVELNVDADNPTGAIRLYQRAGMTTTTAFEIFELDLRGDPLTGPGSTS